VGGAARRRDDQLSRSCHASVERGVGLIFPGMPIHYRSQWYVLHGASPLIFGLASFGQHLFIDRKNELVIARFSSQPLPVDAERMELAMRAVSQIRKALS